MPESILSTLFSQPKFVATNENTGLTMWSKLGIVDVEVASSSGNTDKPLSNQQISDNGTYQSILSQDIQTVKIMQPDRLRVTALCADISTLENVISTFLDNTVTIAINTKSIITSYLALCDVDIEQTGEMISASRVVMTFEQAQPPVNSGYAPEQSADASVYGISIQSPPSVVPLATLVKAVQSAAFIPKVPGGDAVLDSLGAPFILDSGRVS
jgi:hypothetical protein